MLHIVWVISLSFLSSCSAIIYELNDTEHARLPSIWSLDSHAACMEAGGTYCVLQLHLTAEPGNQLMHTIQEYSAHKKHYNYSIIDRGICASTTCAKYIGGAQTTQELSEALGACVTEQVHSTWRLRAHVHSLHYCTRGATHDQPDSWDWTVLAALVALTVANVAGTMYDSRLRKRGDKKQEKVNPIILSFSLKRSWERLTTNETQDPKLQELKIFHGIRVIANLCVLIQHSMMYYLEGFLSNPHDVEKSYNVLFYQLVYNGLMLVQLFFFMSGFLMAYYLQAEEKTRALTAWDVPKILVLRLSRLLPCLLATLALATSWVRHAGSGPLWRLYVTSAFSDKCRAYWWHNLLFINNYTHDGRHCLLPTWHLAADMQVFLVGLACYVLFARRHRVLCVLLVLGAIAPGLHTIFQDLDPVLLDPEAFRTLESRSFWLQHALGHNNLPCFIIGMLTVPTLYNWMQSGGHHRKNRWYSLAQYLALASMPLLMYSSVLFHANGPRPALWLRAGYNVLIRLVIGAVCTLSAPAFFTITPTYLKLFLSWRGWVLPSRLTYSVYLLHFPLIVMLLGAKTDLSYFSFTNSMLTLTQIVVASFLLSVPMYLLVEAPFNSLFKTLAGGYRQGPSTANGTVTKLTNGGSKIRVDSVTAMFKDSNVNGGSKGEKEKTR